MDVELKEVCIGSEGHAPASTRPSTSTEHRSPVFANGPLKEPERPTKSNWPRDKTSKCGDPYDEPYPNVEGDPWEKVYSVLKDHDDTMCDAWTDEIQNLLILAGLFSAIVTAFIIETQKLLQEDPATTTTLFLAHIASQIAVNSSFAVPLPTTTLEPLDKASLSHAFRINSFLFLSLVVSLATALFGILVLQWIRSYRKRETLSYKDLLGLRQCRYDGLMQWKVPEIVSALPILLQFGLVVFFVGLVDFLHLLYPKLAIVIGVFVGLVILVLVLTTILPSLILLRRPKEGNPKYWDWLNRTTLCAYQSPQSWIFLKGTHWVLQTLIVWVQHWDFTRKLLGEHSSRPLQFVLPPTPFPYQNWTSFVKTMRFKAWTPYSLSWVFQNFSVTSEPFCAAFRCFKDLDTPDRMMMVLHDLTKSSAYHRSMEGAEIWHGDKLPSEEFMQDLDRVDNDGFKKELFSVQFLQAYRLLSYDQYYGHHMECYLRCLTEIEAKPSLVKFVDYLGNWPAGSENLLLKPHKEHLWRLQCSNLQNPGQSITKSNVSWHIFWALLDTEWDDLKVITPDEGISMVYDALTSDDAAIQNHAAQFVPTFLYLRTRGRGRTISGRVLKNPYTIACLDFLMTDVGRELLCTGLWGGLLDLCCEEWALVMQEFLVDDKYAELFSALVSHSSDSAVDSKI